MSTELATVTEDGEIVPQRAPITLFGTDDPTAVVERASAVATALAKVIDERRLFSSIGNKKHVQVEGWTLLGSMLGVFAEVEWSRQLDNGWEARAVARTLAGNVVGAAEAMCTNNEGRWRSADPYAVRSMAQTRAVSKALRLPLGFLMHLAGYSATPAEELADDQPEQGGRVPGGATPRTSRPAPVQPSHLQYRREELAHLMVEHHLGLAEVERMVSELGIPADERPLSNASMDRLLAAITETPPTGAETPEAATGQPDTVPASDSAAPSLDAILEATGGELIPPQPGTDEYKALPAHEKAAARAYHSKPAEPETLAEQLAVSA